MHQAQTVSLKVNQQALIKNLEFAFSNSSTYLTELFQNSRRAGASQLIVDWDEATETLTIVDNGCGVDNFQKLLTVAESGWSQPVIENESPFGMGYLSCLFAADHVSVESRGKKMSFATGDALNFNDISIVTSSNFAGSGTRMILQGGKIVQQMKSNTARISNEDFSLRTIKNLVAGYPVPLKFNGTEVPRPHALNEPSLKFFDTPVGQMSISGMNEGSYYYFTQYACVYLQGIRVYSGTGTTKIVVHLDSQRYFGRLPDRDKLVDHETAMHEISEAYTQAWRDHLEAEFLRLGENEFIDLYYHAARNVHPEIFNRMNVLPGEHVRQAHCLHSLSINGDENNPVNTVKYNLCRKAIESGEIAIAALASPHEGNIPAWVYAMKKEVMILCHSLPKGHWAEPYVLDLDDMGEVEIRTNGAGDSGSFYGNYVSGDIVLCESYTIKLTVNNLDLSVDVDDMGMFVSNMEGDGTFYIPAQESSGDSVAQASSYSREYDTLDTDAREEDSDELSQIISLLRGSSVATVFKERICTAGIFIKQFENKLFVTEIGSSYRDLEVKELNEDFTSELATVLTEKLSLSGSIDSDTVMQCIKGCMAISK